MLLAYIVSPPGMKILETLLPFFISDGSVMPAAPLAHSSLTAEGKKAWICSISLDREMFFFLALMPGLFHQTFAKYFLGIKDWRYKSNYGLVPALLEDSEQKTKHPLRWLPHDLFSPPEEKAMLLLPAVSFRFASSY